MKLSEQLKRDHESGDFGKALEGYSDRAKVLEDDIEEASIQDYIKATNRVKISIALDILRDVLPGNDYGISEVDIRNIIQSVRDAQDELFYSYELFLPTL